MPYIVIDENGEIVEEFNGKRIVGLNDGDRVVRKASIEYFKNKKEQYVVKNVGGYYNCLSETFTKVNIEEMRLLLGALDVCECCFLFAVLPYVGYLDCKIRYDNGKCLSVKDFVRLTNMSSSKVYKVIKSLEDKAVICKVKKEYYVNPWLFSRGNKIDKCLKGMFGEYEIRCKDMVRWNDL